MTIEYKYSDSYNKWYFKTSLNEHRDERLQMRLDSLCQQSTTLSDFIVQMLCFRLIALCNMSKFIYVCAMIYAIFGVSSVINASEKKWKLQECFDYAKKNNPQLLQLRQNAEIAYLSWDNARRSRLPALALSVSQNFSFGRSLSFDNTYIYQNVNNTSISISADLPLFTGFRIPNVVKLNMLNYLASRSDVEKMENMLCINIFEAYIQILFNKETLKISDYQVALDSIQFEYVKALEASGRLSYVEVSRQRALLSQSRMSYTQSVTNLRTSLLAMVQLINLSSVEGFDIANTEDSLFIDVVANPTAIYLKALALRPEIQSEKFRAEAARKAVDVAKSYKYPMLSLSGGLSTYYYYSSQTFNNAFFKQLKNNFNRSISLNLNIPIFNRFETNNSIKRAERELQLQILSLERTEHELYNTIQQSYNAAVNARMNYIACLDAVTSSRDAFDLIASKYNRGRVNVLEYSDSKSKYIESKCKLLQAKYELIFAIKKLKFYGGEPLNIL